jgi:GMP synthase-like glutamine amidotransferase
MVESFLKTILLPLELESGIRWSYYNGWKGEFPEEVTDLDMLIVSGSLANAYDTASYPWIEVLLKNLAETAGKVKHLGICFGS